MLQPLRLLSKRKPVVRNLFERPFEAEFSYLGRALLRLKSATVIVFCPRAHLMPETRASGRTFLCICRQAELQKAGRPAFCLRRQTPASGPANLSRQKVNRAFTQLDGIALALLC